MLLFSYRTAGLWVLLLKRETSFIWIKSPTFWVFSYSQLKSQLVVTSISWENGIIQDPIWVGTKIMALPCELDLFIWKGERGSFSRHVFPKRSLIFTRPCPWRFNRGFSLRSVNRRYMMDTPLSTAVSKVPAPSLLGPFNSGGLWIAHVDGELFNRFTVC